MLLKINIEINLNRSWIFFFIIGWLELLLVRVVENYIWVVVFVIDMISDWFLVCGGNEIGNFGIFEIVNMGFNWLILNKIEKVKYG